MKFHLKVHSFIGGVVGVAGPGAGIAGNVGIGAAGINGPDGFGLSPAKSAELAAAVGLLAGGLPGGIIGGLGGYLSGFATGDPNPAFGRGVIGAGGFGGVGGGPSTFAQRALTAPVRAAAKPPVPAPKPKPKPPEKKRTGRQETILTSGLSDATTLKPTLLGQ